MIKDAKLSEWGQELQELIRQLDKDPSNEDLRKAKKNLKERIRVRTAKIIENPELAEAPAKVERVKGSRGKIKKAVVDLMDKGLKDPVEIAKLAGCKVESVRWYLWKLKSK